MSRDFSSILQQPSRAGGEGRESWGAPTTGSESRSVVSDSLQPQGLYSPWNSPGQNTRAGSLSLLGGIFQTQGSNPGLPYCRRILYQLSHKGSPQLGEEHGSEEGPLHEPEWVAVILFLGAAMNPEGFPGGSNSKESACNAGHLGLIPGWGKIPWRREWLPPPVFLPGQSHGQRSLVSYIPCGHKESDTTEQLDNNNDSRTLEKKL